MIAPDEVAAAVVAAAKETGANPIHVIAGLPGGSTIEENHATSRARAYAARALDRVFNRPDIQVARPDIARLVGVNRPSQSAYFSALDQRPTPWWDDDVLKRVVDAVMDVPEPGDSPKKQPTRPQQAVRPLKSGPLPPHDPRKLGLPESRVGRLKRIMGELGPPQKSAVEIGLERRASERTKCRDVLAEAAANTARLQAKLPRESDSGE